MSIVDLIDENRSLDAMEAEFVKAFNGMAELAYRIAVRKGWWDRKILDDGTLENERSDGDLICLIHEELSEAFSACRQKEMPASDHIPEFTGVEEEFADVFIRIFDMSTQRGYRVAEALIAKMRYNMTRPYRHGGKRL